MIFAKYLPHLYQGADHKGHRTYNMGGGGGGGPTQSTVTQTSVPEWLRPQTEAVLGAGMQEYFDATPRKVTNPLTGETTTEYDITGTKPYTPYSQNAADYFAPFSQQQQQVFGETAGMRTPGGFQTGQQMTGMAGQGGLDTVGSAFGYGGQGAGYGGQGAMFGQQAAGTGGMYERMATDPMSMQAYMSPYMQNVVEIQKQQAIEDAQRAQLGANLNAAKYGTYGGARQTLAQTQREAALNKQLSDIQAQGLQSAFDQAQKSQQFGVTSGLQGLQAGISGAQTGIQGAGMGLQGVQGAQAGFGLLGRMGEQAANIGTAQQQADIARLGFQGQMGDIQQQRQQDIINQQIQNFALAQEMPAQRLAGYNALLRGYATPTSTISQYQAAANPLQTIGALGTAAGGFGTLMGGGKKAGGAIKLAGGGGITDKDALESFAERASIPQLQQSMQSGELKGKEYIGAPILQNKIVNEERMKAAQAAMAGGQQQGSGSILDGLLAKADQLQGITSIAEPTQPVTAAGGGVVAFQAGGIPPTRQEEVEQYLKERTGIMGEDEYLKALKDRAKKEPSIYDRLSSAGAQIGLAGSMLRDPGQFGAYAKQAAELQGAQRKSAEERELAFLAAQRAERETKGKAFDVVEGRRQEATKAETERKFRSFESAADRASREAQAKADRESREAQAKEDRASREAIAKIPGKEIQVAQQLMANDPTLSYLDAIDRAAKALSPKDTYNSTRNALTKAAEAVGERMKNLEFMNEEVKEISKKAIKGDKAAQLQYQAIRNREEERIFKEFQVEGVNLSQGAVELKGAPTAPKPAPKPAAPAPAGIPVTAPDGQTFYFPDKKSADQFKRQIAGQK
jgi:hypothetical protein